jgi:uncharacterized SAM-binding protein YcdF (DUF218 family)
MTGLIKSVIEFCIIPLNVFWILMIFSFLWRNNRPDASKKLIIIGLVWLLLTGTKWMPDVLVYGLEKQYDTLHPDSAMFGLPVMVLGGGGIYDTEIPPHDRLVPSSLSRLTEGIRLYNVLEEPVLIFSGYSSENDVTQAAITKEAAVDLGIPGDKIVILEEPTTTEEEAAAYKKYAGYKNPDLILVTSDIHMPRAMYLFKKQGLNPIAAPSDHILRNRKNKQSYWWISHKNNFDKFSAALHEYIGLIWAKIK